MGSRLGMVVARLVRRSSPDGGEASAYEQVTRERADAIARRLDSIELRLNAVLLCVVGAMLAELWKALGL